MSGESFKFHTNFPEVEPHQLCAWAVHYMKHAEWRAIDCRHGDCRFFGCVDGEKHAAVRKSTLASSMAKFFGIEFDTRAASTKCRSYHVAFISTFHHQSHGDDHQSHDDLYSALRRLTEEEDWVVRHTCGCKNCCNPDHLALGTKAENEADKGVHAYLKRLHDINPGDAAEIVEILRRNDINIR